MSQGAALADWRRATLTNAWGFRELLALLEAVQEADRVGGRRVVVFEDQVHAGAACGGHSVGQQLQGL
jgi:hypothetical protein